MNEEEKIIYEIARLVKEKYPSAEVSVVAVLPKENKEAFVIWEHIGEPSLEMIGALDLLKTDVLLEIESDLMDEEVAEGFEDEEVSEE